MTITQSTVRLAQSSEEPEILRLIALMHAESGFRPLDTDCAREMLARVWEKKGGILAVIGAPGHVRAMCYLLITRAWYTRDNHLEELFCWVHPDHRHSDYSKLLIEHAKKCSDDISAKAGVKVPLIIGVLTNKRMEAKVRLYRRSFGLPAGAVFVHNAPWVNRNDLSEEDFWRVPKVARAVFKRVDRQGRKDKARAQA